MLCLLHFNVGSFCIQVIKLRYLGFNLFFRMPIFSWQTSQMNLKWEQINFISQRIEQRLICADNNYTYMSYWERFSVIELNLAMIQKAGYTCILHKSILWQSKNESSYWLSSNCEVSFHGKDETVFLGTFLWVIAHVNKFSKFDSAG